MVYDNSSPQGTAPGSGRAVAIALRRRLDVDLLKSALSNTPPLSVVLATTDILTAKEFCLTSNVDLLVLDANYRHNQSLDVAEDLTISAATRSQLLLLDDYYCPFRARAAAMLHAGYVSRSTPCGSLIEQVKRMARGRLLEPSLVNGLIERGQKLRLDLPQGGSLTEREIEVMILLAEGFTVRHCADILGLSASTVDNHKSSMMRKLEIHKSAEVVKLAIRAGLVDV